MGFGFGVTALVVLRVAALEDAGTRPGHVGEPGIGGRQGRAVQQSPGPDLRSQGKTAGADSVRVVLAGSKWIGMDSLVARPPPEGGRHYAGRPGGWHGAGSHIPPGPFRAGRRDPYRSPTPAGKSDYPGCAGNPLG